jgi:hypothetical protein
MACQPLLIFNIKMHAMSEWVIITNKGFGSDDWIGRSVIEPADVLSGKVGEEQLKKAQLKLGNDFQVETLKSFLPYLSAISIDFPSEKMVVDSALLDDYDSLVI